jgi:hypothetical protein
VVKGRIAPTRVHRFHVTTEADVIVPARLSHAFGDLKSGGTFILFDLCALASQGSNRSLASAGWQHPYSAVSAIHIMTVTVTVRQVNTDR